MLKILIVDDEILERLALTKIITKHIENVKVIGEASNGRLAIDMAIEHSPDVIFMDIRMPGINGLEAISKIKQYNPHTRFIMVSAFNTFEYAKEAMQQGVKEYILKPSRKEDILASLLRVYNEIIEERQQQTEKNKLISNFDRALSFAQKEWVTSLLINPVHETSFEEMSLLLGFEIKAGYSMVFSFRPQTLIVTKSEKEDFYIWLKQALKRVINKEFILGTTIETDVPVLIICKDESDILKYKSNSQSIIRSLNTLFKEKFLDSHLLIGIGEPYNSTKDLSKSFKEASFALKQLDVDKKKIYAFAKKELISSIGPENDLETERNLLIAITLGDINGTIQHYEDFIHNMLTSTGSNIIKIKKSFQELIVVISRTFHELGLYYNRDFNVDEYTEIPTIFDEGKSYLISIVQYIQVWRTKHTKGLLQKAKEYLEENFAQSLSLEEVAEHVELSPFYFSKLFKERFGFTFIDYLTELRISHAKKEMSDLAKSLKEISYSIGYNDPNYFSRVFKKHTGLSPSEFRKAL